jgi:sugar lactone lactonase YvrE
MDYGAVWRIPPGGAAELWVKHPLLEGIALYGPHLGANGVAVNKDYVLVAVSFPARLVKIPIGQGGFAGEPQTMVPPEAFRAAQVFALDDIALDVHGNVYAASPASGPSRIIVGVSADGTQIVRLGPTDGFSATVLSLAFGTRRGERQTIFAVTNNSFGGSGCGVEKLDIGMPSLPIP